MVAVLASGPHARQSQATLSWSAPAQVPLSSAARAAPAARTVVAKRAAMRVAARGRARPHAAVGQRRHVQPGYVEQGEHQHDLVLVYIIRVDTYK